MLFYQKYFSKFTFPKNFCHVIETMVNYFLVRDILDKLSFLTEIVNPGLIMT